LTTDRALREVAAMDGLERTALASLVTLDLIC